MQNDSLIAFEKGKWFEYSASDLRGDSSNLIGAFLDKKGLQYFNFSTATANPYARSYSIIKYQDGLFQPAAVPANCSDFLRADQIIADTANNLLCNVILPSSMFSETELGIFRVSASMCSSIVDFQKADSLIKIADSSIDVQASTLAAAIAVDSSNGLWMTMLPGSDIYRENYGLFHIFGDSITIFNKWNSPLPSNNINCIYVDSSDIIWVGTWGGVAKLHDTTWTIYTTANSGLPDNDVHCFKRASDGSMWIAASSIGYIPGGVVTSNGGVARLKNGQWEAFTRSNSSLPASEIQQIAEDSSGNIWMAAGTSLAVYNPNGVNFASSPLQSRSGRAIGAPVSRVVFGFSSRVDPALSGARYFDIRGRDMGLNGLAGQSKGVCIMRRDGAR